MSKLKDIVKEVFQEVLWEADCILRSDRDVNITKITDNLRGVCGITVVTIIGPAKPVSKAVERSSLRVKFFQVEPTMKQQIVRMSNDARRIDGIYSFIPVHIPRKVRNRIYTA